MTEVPRFLAVDVGGTKLDVGVVDDSGSVLARRRAPTAAASEGGGGALGEALVGPLSARRRGAKEALVATLVQFSQEALPHARDRVHA